MKDAPCIQKSKEISQDVLRFEFVLLNRRHAQKNAHVTLLFIVLRNQKLANALTGNSQDSGLSKRQGKPKNKIK